MSKEKTKKETPTPVVEPQGTLADAANETAEQSLAELEQLREDLEQREQAISEKETTLNEKEAELERREKEIEEKQNSISEKETELSEREKQLEEFEQTLNKKEAELEQRENNQQLTNSNKPTADTPVQFQFGDDTYRFRDDVPLRIRVFGKILTQEQIAQDEDIILQLVVGKSNLIVKVD